MNLKPIKANMTELKMNDYYVLFSYQTPVVIVDRKTGKILVTNKFWSRTTSKHINKYLKENGEFYNDIEKVDQSILDGLLNEGE